MKIIFEYLEWTVEFITIDTNCLHLDLQPEEYHYNGTTLYKYPIYFPVGLLVKFMRDNNYNLEIVY